MNTNQPHAPLNAARLDCDTECLCDDCKSMDAPALESIVESLERIAAQLRGKTLNPDPLWAEVGALEFVAYWLQDLAERREHDRASFRPSEG